MLLVRKGKKLSLIHIYEALNNAARMDTNFIIILNDNNMSISENVGGVSKYLNNIRTSNTCLLYTSGRGHEDAGG